MIVYLNYTALYYMRLYNELINNLKNMSKIFLVLFSNFYIELCIFVNIQIIQIYIFHMSYMSHNFSILISEIKIPKF